MLAEAYMIRIESGTKFSKLPVTTGLNGALFNVNFFFNKQLCCANIESSAERV